MSDGTKIEWTDATWNPVTGCTLVSEGCRNCYAAELAATRLKHHPSRKGLAQKNADGVAKFTGEVRFNEYWLDQPLKWKKPRKIFVCAHGDLFHENVPDEWIDRIFAVMALSPQHVFQVLTKRPERMRSYFAETWQPAPEQVFEFRDKQLRVPAETRRSDRWDRINEVMDWLSISTHDDRFWDENDNLIGRIPWPRQPLQNVWLGTSVEDQTTANERIPHLLETPAALRWVSYEPALGAVDFDHVDLDGDGTQRVLKPYSLQELWRDHWCDVDADDDDDFEHFLDWYECSYASPEDLPTSPTSPRIDWVVAGGESGRNARPMHPDWVRQTRDQCDAAGVPFHFKQWGEWLPWEPGSAPYWKSQNGQFEDSCHLFPVNMDDDTTWDDGLSFVAHGELQSVFQRVGKKVSGRTLDGVVHDAFPELAR